MPPKRIQVQPPTRRGQPKGYFGSVYHTLTSEENASVVLSVAMFGVRTTHQSFPYLSLRYGVFACPPAQDLCDMFWVSGRRWRRDIFVFKSRVSWSSKGPPSKRDVGFAGKQEKPSHNP